MLHYRGLLQGTCSPLSLNWSARLICLKSIAMASFSVPRARPTPATYLQGQAGTGGDRRVVWHARHRAQHEAHGFGGDQALYNTQALPPAGQHSSLHSARSNGAQSAPRAAPVGRGSRMGAGAYRASCDMQRPTKYEVPSSSCRSSTTSSAMVYLHHHAHPHTHVASMSRAPDEWQGWRTRRRVRAVDCHHPRPPRGPLATGPHTRAPCAPCASDG